MRPPTSVEKLLFKCHITPTYHINMQGAAKKYPTAKIAVCYTSTAKMNTILRSMYYRVCKSVNYNN